MKKGFASIEGELSLQFNFLFKQENDMVEVRVTLAQLSIVLS